METERRKTRSHRNKNHEDIEKINKRRHRKKKNRTHRKSIKKSQNNEKTQNTNKRRHKHKASSLRVDICDSHLSSHPRKEHHLGGVEVTRSFGAVVPGPARRATALDEPTKVVRQKRHSVAVRGWGPVDVPAPCAAKGLTQRFNRVWEHSSPQIAAARLKVAGSNLVAPIRAAGGQALCFSRCMVTRPAMLSVAEEQSLDGDSPLLLSI